ncbi:MAG TPA: magnesium/cobalt transporter CorA [Vicinamibacterales bacterium]
MPREGRPAGRMISVYVYHNGETQKADRVEPQWLDPASSVTLWVDVVQPTPEEGQQLLAGTFHFHPLSVEDALSEIHHPKVEPYDRYLYVILHGIDFQASEHQFATHDIDFFLARNYLVTVHDGRSRSIQKVKDLCRQHAHILEEGPVALMHRIVDSMVDNYAPELAEIEEQMDELEDKAVLGEGENLMRPILAIKRDLSALRRVVIPQRDVVGRLARREFPEISNEMAYRFRDVYDHLVRYSDEAVMFQDRVTGILEGYLSAISNRLNRVMKVLTVVSTIVLPMTVLTGLWGMNVPLPHFAGTDVAQFWWVVGIMGAITVGMLAIFRWRRWI